MVVLISGIISQYIFLINPITELCLWHVKYLGHGAAGNVMTSIGVI